MIAEIATGALIISLIVTAYAYVKVHYSRQAKFLAKFPSPPKWPILGSALELNVSNEEMTRIGFEYPNKYGPRFGVQIGPRCYFVSMKKNDLEKIMGSSVHIQKAREYRFSENWAGDGLLTSTGSKWFHRRKLLTPSFHFKILDEFMTVFNAQAKIFVNILKEDSEGGKRPLEICQYVTRCTLDIICETAMGRTINAQLVKDSPYVRAIYGLGALLQYRAVRPWFHPNFIWRLTPGGRKERRYLKIIHGFTMQVIRERKAELERDGTLHILTKDSDETQLLISTKNRAAAFMDLLLRHQAAHPDELSDKDIREETDTFMFEGHDTTAASLSWTMHLLGLYPDKQEKVYEELKGICGENLDKPVTSQDLSQMKYLECCIKESLRLYPSVPIIGREVTEDIVLEDGTTIPKGCAVPIFILSLHRDEKVFPNPEEFIPERFLPENANGRHPFAYLPFSAGPRNCIGQKFALMEEKVILSHILRKFRIEALDKREDVVIMTELILRPRDGLRVLLHPR